MLKRRLVSPKIKNAPQLCCEAFKCCGERGINYVDPKWGIQYNIQMLQAIAFGAFFIFTECSNVVWFLRK